MSKRGLNSIYTYTDFRAYLRDYFSIRRQDDPAYSHRAMAKELGFTSPNYVKLVMDDKRNMGLRSLNRLLDGLGLRNREKEYFSYLVFFCQASTAIDKNYYFGLLTSFRAPINTAAITPAEYRYYSKWYNSVVRELIVREKSPVDFSSLARKIRPSITKAQAKKSVELILELGLVRKKEDGSYEQSSRLIGTEREVTSIGIRNYHAKMMELGRESMDTVPRDKREISSLTLCVSEACRQDLKKRVQEFEDEVLQKVRDDSGSRLVYQLNFQFFPLSGEDK